MLYLLNLTLFFLCGLITLAVKRYFFDDKINRTFHFTPYVFKNKENVFNARTLENALTDMLQTKLENVYVDTIKLQDKVYADFVTKTNPSNKVKNIKKYITENEKEYDEYLRELNKKYENIFEYNILKINIQKININLLLKSIINLSKNNTKIAILLKNNDKNAIKIVFFISNGNIEKKIIYDKLNILSLIKNNYKSKKVIKNKSFSPKINSIKLHYNFVSTPLLCTCHKSCISYSNIFGQKLAEVKFGNVKFFSRRHIVSRADVTKCFADTNIVVSPNLARCMKINFASNIMQSMYDKVCNIECEKATKDILHLRYDYDQTNTPYNFFIQKMLGIKVTNNNISIHPDRRYVNCDFRVLDYACEVKVGHGKNEYMIDGKTFSSNIPIALNDIEKVDCILY